MSAKVEISRTDRTAGDLKAMAKKSKCKDHRRRLRAIARVLAGEESRSEVAKRAGVDLQTLRDRVRRYSEEGADGLKNRSRSGRRTRLDADQAEAVREWLETGPPGRRRHPAEDRESFRDQLQRRGGAHPGAQAGLSERVSPPDPPEG